VTMPRVLLALAVAATWALAGWSWPDLPPRFPVHFDARGNPDGWAAKSALAWFALPGLGTVIAALLGLGLPAWIVAMARSNSPWLNVPNKKAFAALPEDARVRAVAGPVQWLIVLAIALQALFAWIVYGGARVASGEWRTLPSWPSWLLVAAVVVCATAQAFFGARAIRREVERAR